jgi:outer membrane protein OmpA-like peptidoglycan-associated protein
MKAPRAALLATLLCLCGAAASAQTAVTISGDVGLFTIPTADALRPGQFTLGAYFSTYGRTAGNLPFTDTTEDHREYRWTAETFSIGVGITDWWSIYASGGAEQWDTGDDWLGGTINGLPLAGNVDQGESQKIGLVNKFVFGDPQVSTRFALWFGAKIPASEGDIRFDEINGGVVTDTIESRRTDWVWGGSFTRGVLTGMASYKLAGDHDLDLRAPNELRFAVGVDFPIKPVGLHLIGEIDRIIYDGPDFDQPNQSTLLAGARWFLGNTGLAFSGAIGANLDMLFGEGGDLFAGLVGVTYSPFPAPPPPPVVMPAPAPAEAAPIEEPAAPVPVAPAPPAPAPTMTTDEIQFDAGSARLTNIAKAILDGVALRMKNDLNATATVTGFSDNSGSEETNMAISARRAEAAKEYLVTRHGIDPGRIATFAKGSMEPAYDNATEAGRAKNRRAVIVVTLVSGN